MTDVAFVELAFQTDGQQVAQDFHLGIPPIGECTPHSLVLECFSSAWRSGVGVVRDGIPFEPPVIPAKAAIQSVASAFPRVGEVDSRFRGNDRDFERPCLANGTTTGDGVVGQFAVAALSERRNSLRIQGRRSETAATKIKLTHYRRWRGLRVSPHLC
jgi:hypothetical protein